MPAVRKPIPGSGAGGAKRTPQRRQHAGFDRPPIGPAAPMPTLALPTEASEPESSLEAYTWLIHGAPKVGKTSLIARFNGVLFAMFEPGGKALRIYQTPLIRDWEAMRGYISLLGTEEHPYRAVCLDTGTKAYDICMQWVMRNQLAGSHPGEIEDYGAGWKRVTWEFTEMHAALSELGLGFFVTAHTRTMLREWRRGEKQVLIEPYFSGSCSEFYEGVIDVIAYYHYDQGQRWLQIRGDESVVAGCRIDHLFRTPAGERVVRIPMGQSSEEAYENVRIAFANEQERTYAEVETRAPFKKRKIRETN